MQTMNRSTAARYRPAWREPVGETRCPNRKNGPPALRAAVDPERWLSGRKRRIANPV